MMVRRSHGGTGALSRHVQMLLVTTLLVAVALPVYAQGVPRGGRRAAARQDPLADAGAGQQTQGGAQYRRQQMERQLRRGLWRIAKQRVGFDDAQMLKLESTTQRYDQRRRALAQQERAVRQTLRQQILADGAADQSAVSAALDRLHELQRQRLDLQMEEQTDFSSFMTPLQRAKFAVLQDQVRRRVEALRRARPDSASGQVSP